ncbi:MAG: hypothetical protein ABIN94_17510 [Ferruginibacter sp.]
MGNDITSVENTPATVLIDEIQLRKEWFFECQLRGLELESFRDIEVKNNTNETLLNLVSEPSNNAPLGSTTVQPGRIYLDSKQPVWTQEERDQRSAFKDVTVGRGLSNWLNYCMPLHLAKNLAVLKELYEESTFGSNIDNMGLLNDHSRIDPSISVQSPQEQDRLAHAIARAAIVEQRPWLIPEVFNMPNFNSTEAEEWISNGEKFVSNFENELNEILGGGQKPAFELGKPDDYRLLIRAMLQKSVDAKNANSIAVEFLDQSAENWAFNIKLQSPASPSTNLMNYAVSDSVKYWINCCGNALKEVYVNKAEADMGLCLVMRAVYLYGTLPSALGAGEKLRWRNRKAPDKKLYTFFDVKNKLNKNDPERQDRLLTLETKLQVLLEETALIPHSCAIHFSPLAQEIIKQDVLRFKFWLDEPYHAYDYHGEDQDKDNPKGINKARKDFDKGTIYSEMEYWSENHYIMFASSEYLAGQLWENENFQPAKDFLNEEDKKSFGIISGAERKERGKARVLKWMNNRLLYGWTEFNSSGYYREHLYALLNLVDFALDEEVHKKAVMVTDLLFFDVTRFLHKGNMGACGGRSQFPSKNSGWDNALGDVIEIMLGTRGIFIERSGDIGCSFSTSTYKVPAVLIEIAKNPPEMAVDRTRVSINFDDASKYGIAYSKKSIQKDSLDEGFKSKRDKYFPELEKINLAIEKHHPGYGRMEDDTIFWWSLSAYYNKEVVRNSFKCAIKYKLEKNKAFGTLKVIVDVLSHVLKIVDFGLLATPIVGGIFEDDAFANHLERGSEELAILLEGSTRSRVNIYTYRNRDIMLSSLQNFRTGQLNIQSNVQQATINTELNVFTTSGFPGLSISDVGFGIGGGLMGALGAYTMGVAAAGGLVVGAVSAILLNELVLEGMNPFGDQGDGPGWWTGYWALPMVVQHEGAAIIAYDFHTLQEKLTDIGSHVWFPKSGFDAVESRRSSAYDDSNFVLSDVVGILPNIGPRGYWLFGQKVHKENPDNPAADPEGYIAVFSNRHPEWQDKDSEFYEGQVKEAIEKPLKEIEQKIKDINDGMDNKRSKENNEKIEQIKNLYKDAANHKRTWANPVAPDFFAEKDWYADGKNIWIIQVGSKSEFGSFENFKDRVTRATVEVDDVGTMECVYHMPKPDGSSQALSLKYKDEILLDGNHFQIDLYPRFENKFIRGGKVEWGQREYVIEYNGRSLFHDFSNMEVPLRDENAVASLEELLTVKGLVIYLRTGDEPMEVFTVASATVKIGCKAVAVDEVIAAGEIRENSFHDAEWIFFDMPANSDTDMTIDIAHHSIPGKGDEDSEWKLTYNLFALMGDRSLKPCSVRQPAGTFYLRDKYKSTGAYPFSVQLNLWRTWTVQGNTAATKTWTIADQPANNLFYFDYIDQFVTDKDNILWHRKLGPCAAATDWENLTPGKEDIVPIAPYHVFGYSTMPGYLFVFAVSGGALYSRWIFQGDTWALRSWVKMNITYQPMLRLPLLPIEILDTTKSPQPVPVGMFSRVMATLIDPSTITPAVYLSGADGNFYACSTWPLDGVGNWQKIETASVFTSLLAMAFQIGGGFLFALDDKSHLWRYPLLPGKEDVIVYWEPVTINEFIIQDFIIATMENMVQVIAVNSKYEVWAISLDNETVFPQWERVGVSIDFKTAPGAKLACSIAIQGRVDIFTSGKDDKIYTTWWTKASGWETGHNWEQVAPDNQTFTTAVGGDIKAITRVNGQVELYATASDRSTWKNWWS